MRIDNFQLQSNASERTADDKNGRRQITIETVSELPVTRWQSTANNRFCPSHFVRTIAKLDSLIDYSRLRGGFRVLQHLV
jgi:hypothetical protein